MEKELIAMRHIAKILNGLDQGEKERVMTWIQSRTATGTATKGDGAGEAVVQ